MPLKFTLFNHIFQNLDLT